MDVLQNTFFDHPELHRLCVACATDCTNVMSSAEGMNSDYLRPKKKHKRGSAHPPSQSTQKEPGDFNNDCHSRGNTSYPIHCLTVATV